MIRYKYFLLLIMVALSVTIAAFPAEAAQFSENAVPSVITPSQDVVTLDSDISTAAQPILIDSPDTLTLGNEFIKIIVNKGPEDLGRFAVETSLGDPQNPNDDNQSLIFGRPIPWTSYATIRIDDQDYVFGGINKKIQKRSGVTVNFGTVVTQNLLPDNIYTECMYDAVHVTQTLSLFRNPSTRVKDNAIITYTLHNGDSVAHTVGVRIMMDTKLGPNDGAPFRIGDDSVISEKLFSGKELFHYWQTFDDLSSPNVIAQGTIELKQAGIFPPDRMYLVNWGTLADHPWDFTYQEGRSFVRAGEFDKDTALALYWEPIELKPGESRTIKTLYGLGGVSLAPGELSLGLTSPAEIHGTSKDEILVIGYVSNSGGFDSADTSVSFTLPEEFQISQGQNSYEIGLLPAGETRQFPIKISLKKINTGSKVISFKAHSKTLEDNQITRTIDILAPPKLKAALRVDEAKFVSFNPYLDAVVTITNPSPLTIENIYVKLSSKSGYAIPSFDIQVKTISSLKSGESKQLSWKLKQTMPVVSSTEIFAEVYSDLTGKTILSRPTCMFYPDMTFSLTASTKNIETTNYFYINVGMQNAYTFDNMDMILSYDSKNIKFIRLSQEPWLIDIGPNRDIITNSSEIKLLHLSNSDRYVYKPICKAHFKALQPGNYTFTLKVNDEIRAEETVYIRIKEPIID
ncbi:hypothetical protein ACFL96_00835 [Thermoproteota archaeon]